MKYTEEQMTPWFDGSVNPVRDGVYQRNYSEFAGRWDGQTWCRFERGIWYSWRRTERGARVDTSPSSVVAQWRGLNFDPSDKK